MNLFAAWKKVLLFGAFGAVGCLAGWAVGEVYLEVAKAAAPAGSGRAPSLINKPTAPSGEAPPPPREFQERLSAAGAKSGDVQISLIWSDENDLDLHCIDPSGFEICWKPNQRYSMRTSGELDVDRNAGCRVIVPDPVENIYWAKGKAPMGKYSVYLDFYQRCGRGPDESRYKINVLHGGERKEFTGTIRKEGPGEGGPLKLIYEFQLRPQIELFAPAEFEVAPGTAALKVPVAVRREFFQGAVTVKAEGLPAYVTADLLTLQPNQSEGDLLLKATDAAVPGKAKIKLVATGEGVSHSADPELAVASPAAQFSLWTVISVGLWTALLAVGLCLALVAGQNRYLNRPLFASGRVPLWLVIVGAAGAGFVSGSIGQVLFFAFFSLGVAKLGTLLGWMLLGALLGAGVSYFVPNLDAKKAALAGVAGGFLGAIAFLIFSYAADMLGRFGGAALLGFCIGLMVAIVETAFRRAWLEVRFSEREVITVNLGPEPVKVGGDSRACTVWARGAEAIALRYWIRDGKVFCEDVPTKRESTVGDGDSRTAGNVTVVVRTTNVPHAPPLAASRAAAPPVPPPAKPQAAEAKPAPLSLDAPAPKPAPPPPPPAKTARDDYDDGMPMPIGPPPPPRPAAKSILDDDYPAPAPKVAPKPTAPPAAEPRPLAPKPPAPAAPPAPKPPTPAAQVAGAPKPGDPDACPSCGRKAPGKPGARYCMVCDKTF